jgi:NAD(P)H-dependent FMN reductase
MTRNIAMIPTVLAIIGSASRNSINLQVVEYIRQLLAGRLHVIIFDELRLLPHFDPELSTSNVPEPVLAFRKQVEDADGILICTPEYVFSIPAGLKNAIEWCVATTVFTNKPCGLITASSSGAKAHEELQLLMRTLMADIRPDTTLLIQAPKAKFRNGQPEPATASQLDQFAGAFHQHVTSFVNRP